MVIATAHAVKVMIRITPIRPRSPQLELHCHFDNHVDRRAEARRRRELPLPHRLDRAIVEPAAEPLQDLDVPDRAVAADDDLEHDVAGDAGSPRPLRVIGLHLAQQPWRRDSRSWPVRTAAGAATRARTDAGTVAFADAGPLAGSDAAALARTVAVFFGPRLLQHADAVAVVRRRRDNGRNDAGQRLGGDWRGLRLGRRGRPGAR